MLTLGPAPRQGNTDKVLESQRWQGRRGMPHSWAPGPTQVQQEAGCPTCGSGHKAWELTWAPPYTGQPLQSCLFSLNFTIPKNK